MYTAWSPALFALVTFTLGVKASSESWLDFAVQQPIDRARSWANQAELGGGQDIVWNSDTEPEVEEARLPGSLSRLLSSLEKMQDTYFSTFAGAWPNASDWTATVMQTHISGTLSTVIAGADTISNKKRSAASDCTDRIRWENLVNKYYAQTQLFYFGENAFALRDEAYDDMLWVVLGWLENIKFAEAYDDTHWNDTGTQWHGLQTRTSAAHRARIFYDLASKGWETKLCGGGMLWNPLFDPYKNAITNELYAAASIAMYLHFPGDNNTSAYQNDDGRVTNLHKPHDPVHLQNAIKTYKWLKESGMMSRVGLWQDGFHVSGWNRYRNGTVDPGSGECDRLNRMVYTYNQGVILSASRGLWLATGAESYLDDGHKLVNSVMRATGWLHFDEKWHGLGRAGVLEDFCDHRGYCNQDGQTFKGIFFHHLIEFCRPLNKQDEDFLELFVDTINFDDDVYQSHLYKCATYAKWIEHNAKAAWKTRNKEGLFGMWWGVAPGENRTTNEIYPQQLPPNATDYRNPTGGLDGLTTKSSDLNERGRGRNVETQAGGVAVLRAHWQWQSLYS